MTRVILGKEMANRGSWYVFHAAADKVVAASLKCARGAKICELN